MREIMWGQKLVCGRASVFHEYVLLREMEKVKVQRGGGRRVCGQRLCRQLKQKALNFRLNINKQQKYVGKENEKGLKGG